MQTLDLQIPVGGTFRIKGRIRNPLDNTYWDFSTAEMNFYVEDNAGTIQTELTASTTDSTITIEDAGTVFSVYVDAADTATIDFKWGKYTLWVTWPNGDEIPLVEGRLTPTKPVKP